jgi:DNA-binding transcriptional LysR family regulator
MDLTELLPLLPSLAALLQERNVTRAAQQLGVSQPRMSARLARLRELLDDPLLTPAARGRGMAPTPRAEALYDRLAAALVGLEAAFAEPEPFDVRTSSRTFTIMADDNTVSVIGPALVDAIRAAGADGVRLAFLEPPISGLAERLERGAADLLIGLPSLLDREPALIRRILIKDRFVVVQRRGHPRGRGPMELDTFCRLDHVVLSEAGGGFTGPVDAYLARLGRSRRVAVSVQGFLLTLGIVARSDLIATLPRRLLQPFEQAVEIFEAPFGPPVIDYGAAWHARMQEDPIHKWLREILMAAFRDHYVQPA